MRNFNNTVHRVIENLEMMTDMIVFLINNNSFIKRIPGTLCLYGKI